jgi:hypothetical protein
MSAPVVCVARAQVEDEKRLGGRIGAEDLAKVTKLVREELAWMDSHDEAKKEDFAKRKAKFQKAVDPIVDKVRPCPPRPAAPLTRAAHR